jgi:transcriptional antiterminator NusG
MEETTTNINAAQNAEQDLTKWYVLRVVSGKERKVKEYLDKEVNRSGWSEGIQGAEW